MEGKVMRRAPGGERDLPVGLILAAIILFIPLTPAHASGDVLPRTPAASRGEVQYHHCTNLTGGAAFTRVSFDEGGSPSTVPGVRLGGSAVVTDARFILSGAPTVESSETLASNYSNHPGPCPVQGWWDAIDDPTDSSPQDLLSSGPNPVAPLHLGSRDGYGQGLSSTNNDLFFLFNFTVNADNATFLDLEFCGWGAQFDDAPSDDRTFFLSVYVWDHTAGAWSSDPGFFNPLGKGGPHSYHSYFWQVSDLIDDEEGVWALVTTPKTALRYNTLTCDFVNLNATNGSLNYPHDTYLDIGDDGTVDWVHPGLFSTGEVVDEANHSITEGIQDFLDSYSGPWQNPKIPLVLGSSSAGALVLSHINITWYIPYAPYQTRVLPDFAILEDSDWHTILDLDGYFDDDLDAGWLRYEIGGYKTPIDHPVLLKIADDGHRLMAKTVREDWYGVNAGRWIEAYDNGTDGIPDTGDDRWRASNEFNITVTPTNDPPTITAVRNSTIVDGTAAFRGDKGATEDELYVLNVTVHDPDGDDYTISSNLTDGAGADDHPRFGVSADGRCLHFSPVQEDVGHLYLRLTVTEVNASVSPPLNHSVSVFLNVKNVNDPPIILVGDIYAPEDRWTKFEIEAVDPESAMATEELRFGCDIDDSVPGIHWGSNYRFDKFTGEVAIRPDNSMVGKYVVNLSARDMAGATTYALRNLYINNTNDAPVAVISNLLDGAVRVEGDRVILNGTGSYDEDLVHNDELIYEWTAALHDRPHLLSVQGSLTHFDRLIPGNYTITLRVTDRSGAFDEASVNITVEEAPGGPEPWGRYGLSLELGVDSIVLEPGDSTEVMGTVYNEGGVDDVVTLYMQFPPKYHIGMPEEGAGLIVPAGGHHVFSVQVSIPEGIAEGSGFTIRITAESSGSGGAVRDMVTLNVTVEIPTAHVPPEPVPEDPPMDDGGGGSLLFLLALLSAVAIIVAVSAVLLERKRKAVNREKDEDQLRRIVSGELLEGEVEVGGAGKGAPPGGMPRPVIMGVGGSGTPGAGSTSAGNPGAGTPGQAPPVVPTLPVLGAPVGGPSPPAESSGGEDSPKAHLTGAVTDPEKLLPKPSGRGLAGEDGAEGGSRREGPGGGEPTGAGVPAP